jgi:anti-sigma factor RsiW
MKCDRLGWDLLVRAVDKELSQAEEQVVVEHLAACELCRREYAAIEDVSRGVEFVVSGAPVFESSGDREKLAAQMSKRELLKPVRQAPEKVMRRFGWGMALAATLALAIILAPRQRAPLSGGSPAQSKSAAAIASAIEVDGESFIALPYSNPDLSASAPRIVQMQVPVSSLADIGIAIDPVTKEVLNPDRSVLADVLLGADGQPLGVHVVSWE